MIQGSLTLAAPLLSKMGDPSNFLVSNCCHMVSGGATDIRERKCSEKKGIAHCIQFCGDTKEDTVIQAPRSVLSNSSLNREMGSKIN